MPTKTDVVNRVSERLQLVGEGATLSSIDRVTIERAIDDVHAFERLEIPYAWDLDAIPDASLGPLDMYVSAVCAANTAAQTPERHEANLAHAKKQLRVVNRTKPDNSVPTEVTHY